MKKLRILGFMALTTVLMAADCSNKDSEFYNDVFLSSADLIDVEQQPTYSVGDIIYVNTDNFERVIPENGQTAPLDVYQTTGGAPSFTFTYLLEKSGASGEWSTVQTNESDLVTDRGASYNFSDFVQAQALFDVETQSYEYRGGIRLTSPGSYRLRFTYNNPASRAVILVSDSVNSNLFATIYSDCSDLDGGGYYNFTVN